MIINFTLVLTCHKVTAQGLKYQSKIKYADKIKNVYLKISFKTPAKRTPPFNNWLFNIATLS